MAGLLAPSGSGAFAAHLQGIEWAVPGAVTQLTETQMCQRLVSCPVSHHQQKHGCNVVKSLVIEDCTTLSTHCCIQDKTQFLSFLFPSGI